METPWSTEGQMEPRRGVKKWAIGVGVVFVIVVIVGASVLVLNPSILYPYVTVSGEISLSSIEQQEFSQKTPPNGGFRIDFQQVSGSCLLASCHKYAPANCDLTSGLCTFKIPYVGNGQEYLVLLENAPITGSPAGGYSCLLTSGSDGYDLSVFGFSTVHNFSC
jgi:hypothetical protein